MIVLNQLSTLKTIVRINKQQIIFDEPFHANVNTDKYSPHEIECFLQKTLVLIVTQ